MKDIILMIDDPILKGRILRVILSHEYNFTEARDLQELFIKLELFEGVGLIVMDAAGDTISFEVARRIKNTPRYGHIKVLVILEKGNKKLIDLAHKEMIDDLMLLPFQEDVFQRKVSALAGSRERVSQAYHQLLQLREVPLPENLLASIRREIKAAQRGKYTLSVVPVKILNADQAFLERINTKIRRELRETDIILVLDDISMLVILPFTDEEGLPLVENRIRSIYEETLETAASASLYLYGLRVMEEEMEAEGLLRILEHKVNSSISYSKTIIDGDHDTKNRLSRMRNLVRMRRL